jgi:hypothetical protein
MGVQGRIKKFATVQAAKAILKILPRVSEKSLLLHGRRTLGRSSKSCLDKFARNLIVNEFIAAALQREEFHTRFGFDPPFFIVLSPIMRCNLACYGCYAGEYE